MTPKDVKCLSKQEAARRLGITRACLDGFLIGMRMTPRVAVVSKRYALVLTPEQFSALRTHLAAYRKVS